MSLIHLTTLLLIGSLFVSSLIYNYKIEKKHKTMILGLHKQFLYLRDKLPKE